MVFKRKWVVVLLLTVAFAVRADLKLTGIMYSHKDPSALVNGARYRINEEVAGFAVVSIDRQSATFRNISTGKEIILPIGSSFHADQEVIVGPDIQTPSAIHSFSDIIRNGGASLQDEFSSMAEKGLPPLDSNVMKGVLIFVLALTLFKIVTWWRVCSRAGQPGWSMFIPIYNLYVVMKVAGKPGWWLLLMFLPVVNLIVSILIPFGIARTFGRGPGFAIGLLLLPVIFYPVLAFGRE
jgi:hypothetical protein